MRRMWLLDRTWIDAVAHIDVKGVKSKLEFMIELRLGYNFLCPNKLLVMRLGCKTVYSCCVYKHEFEWILATYLRKENNTNLNTNCRSSNVIYQINAIYVHTYATCYSTDEQFSESSIYKTDFIPTTC